MKLIEIESETVYAIKYDDEIYNEYDRIFEDYGDFETVLDFFETYKWQIASYYVRSIGFSQVETEAYANRVIEEAEELEDRFEEYFDEVEKGNYLPLKEHFIVLEGFEKEDMPALKSYGTKRPSLLRVYAVEIDARCMVIFYSGIKICQTLSECPVLKDNVLNRAREVIKFLRENNPLEKEVG